MLLLVLGAAVAHNFAIATQQQLLRVVAAKRARLSYGCSSWRGFNGQHRRGLAGDGERRRFVFIVGCTGGRCLPRGLTARLLVARPAIFLVEL